MTVRTKEPQSRVTFAEEDESNLSESENEDNSSSHSESASNNEDNSEHSSEHESTAISNAGWADSISKILKTNKPKHKKTLVLSKAKKLNEVKKKDVKSAGFQVQTTDGEVREEEIEATTEAKKNTDEPPRKKKRDIASLRIKPNVIEKDRERTLSKIATKGVVHLFNAVKSQQKDISKKLKEAGPLEVRKERVLKSIDKRAFLDVLMGEKSQNVNNTVSQNATVEKSEGNSSTWSVLRDDFMMSAKMKDWDKELEENESEEECNIESD